MDVAFLISVGSRAQIGNASAKAAKAWTRSVLLGLSRQRTQFVHLYTN